jgi:DNA modification methylase
MACEIIHGDALEVLKGMEANSVDAVVTDPPYGLVGASRGSSSQPGDLATPYGRSGPSKKRGGFMGKEWDASIPGAEYWSEALRIAKPGAYILAFGGTRTFHRLAVAIEDAGWEIRDTLMWVYGSGFPKSRNVCLDMDKMDGHGNRGHRIAVANRHHPDGTLEPNGEHLPAYEPKTDAAKQWAGWGTALKPAWEPIIMARKPMVGTVAENVLAHGTGAINVDGCRVEGTPAPTRFDPAKHGHEGWRMNATGAECAANASPLGRWPANLIHDGSDEVLAGFPVTVASKAGGKSGTNANPMDWEQENPNRPRGGHNDNGGSAARFFKTCEHDEFPLLLCDAKAIFGAWKTSPANTAESPSHQPSPSADFVRDLVLFAEHCGATLQSRRWTEHFTNATPIELSDLCTLVTMAILFTEARSWRVSQPAKHTLPNSRVSIAETNEQTGITTITIDRSTSDGFAEVATFGIMPLNAVRGEAASASRLVYCAKASKSDRGESNGHPTVKPTELMRYLVRLVTPPGGKIIDPFTGSGSTGKAAVLEGFEFIGIEREAEYVAIAEARIAEAQRQLGLFA